MIIPIIIDLTILACCIALIVDTCKKGVPWGKAMILESDNPGSTISFVKERPICCRKEMYAAGGTIGKISKGSVRFWRCGICGQECEDIAS